MSDVIDLVHRLSYEVNTSGIESVTKELTQQTDRINQLTERLRRLSQLQATTGDQDIARRQRINALIGRTQQALEREGNAVENTVLNNQELTRALQRQNGIVGQLEQRMGILRQRRDAAFDPENLRRYNRELSETQQRLNAARSAGLPREQAHGSSGGLGVGGIAVGSAIGTAVSGVVGSAIGAIKGFATDIVSVTNKYEKLQALLANTLGGKQAGDDAFSLLTKFAAETPFQLDELTQDYLKFVNRGIKPTKEELTAFGDIAASQGKSFDQFTEAVLDATTGEFERLKEFGIKAVQNGNNVTLAFGNITKTVPKTADAIKQALLQIRNEAPGIAGAMKIISNTTEGALSNLSDNFDRLKNTIGSGFTSALKNSIGFVSDLVSAFNDFIAIPVEDKLRAEQIGLNGVVEALIANNDNEQIRSELIGELNAKYPEFLGHLSQEEITTKNLTYLLSEANDQYDRRITLIKQSSTADILKKQKEQALQDVGTNNAALYGAAVSLGINTNSFEKTDQGLRELGKTIDQEIARLRRFGSTVQDIKKAQAAADQLATGNDGGFFSASTGANIAEVAIEQNKKFGQSIKTLSAIEEDSTKTKQEYATNIIQKIRAIQDLLDKDPSVRAFGKEFSVNGILRNIFPSDAALKVELDKLKKELNGEDYKNLVPKDLIIEQEKPKTTTSTAAKQKKKKEETEEQRQARLLKEQQLKYQTDFDTKLLALQKAYRIKQEETKNLFPGIDSIEPLAELQEKNANDVLQLQVANQDARLATLKKFGKATADEVTKIDETKYNLAIKAADEINKLEDEAAAREKARREKAEADRLARIAAARKEFEDDAKRQLDNAEILQNNTLTALYEGLRDGKLTKAEKQPIADLLGIDVNSGVDKFVESVKRAFDLKNLVLKLKIETARQDAPGQTKEDGQESKKVIADLKRQIAELQAQITASGQTVKADHSVQDYYEAITSAAVQAYNTIAAARQADLDHAISIQEKRVEAAGKIAERGNSALLEKEQQRLDELQRKKEAAARAELVVNEALTLSNSILAVAKAAGQSGGGAIVLIPTIIAALVAGFSFVRTLTNDAPAGFKEGGYTGDGDTGKVAGVVHGREYVVRAEATEKYRPILEQMNELRFKPPPLLIPNHQGTENIIALRATEKGLTKGDLKGLEKRLDNVEQAIKSRPGAQLNFDRRGVVAIVDEIHWQEELKRRL